MERKLVSYYFYDLFPPTCCEGNRKENFFPGCFKTDKAKLKGRELLIRLSESLINQTRLAPSFMPPFLVFAREFFSSVCFDEENKLLRHSDAQFVIWLMLRCDSKYWIGNLFIHSFSVCWNMWSTRRDGLEASRMFMTINIKNAVPILYGWFIS